MGKLGAGIENNREKKYTRTNRDYPHEKQPCPHETFEAAIAELGNQFREQLSRHAQRLNVGDDALLKAVVSDLPGEDARADGRARDWRVRMFIFDYARGLDEPVANTDPELGLGLPGTLVLRGLPAVMKYIAKTTSDFHGAACVGLDQNTLKRKLNTLRTMMAYRQDGTATLRIDYQVHNSSGIRYMFIRRDIVQVGKGGDAPRRKLLGGRWTS